MTDFNSYMGNIDTDFFRELCLRNGELRYHKRNEFMKIHRSYIINMDYIQSIEAGEIITYSGKSFPVSRLLVKDIKERYMNYIFTGEV